MNDQDALPNWLPMLVSPLGLSGLEDAVARVMAQVLAQQGADVRIDGLGNVIARIAGKSPSPRVAVVAHMDTVGFLVNRFYPDGSLGVVAVGGVNFKALPGTPVIIGSDPGSPVYGVFGVRSQHLTRPGEGIPTSDELYIQIDPADVPRVEITTPVRFLAGEPPLGETLVCSPYLDNRAGCAALLTLAQRLADRPPAGEVVLIGSVQEETTCAGAYHALAEAQPDAAIFVDGTLSYDTPDTRGLGSVRLGDGPVLTAFLYVSGLNGWHAHPGLRAHLRRVAADEGIPVQHDAIRGLMSDARTATQLGIPSALIGIPMRGKHSPAEIIHRDDVSRVVELLAATLQRPLPDLKRG